MENVKIHFAEIDKSIELEHTFSQKTILYLTFFAQMRNLKQHYKSDLLKK